MVKGEVNYSIHDTRPGFREFIGLEYFYKHVAYMQSDSIIIAPADYLANYTITKYISSCRLKIGQQQLLTHHFMLEWYMGAGVRYRNALSSLTQDQTKHIDYEDEGFYRESSDISKSFWPDITIGIRFGYRY